MQQKSDLTGKPALMKELNIGLIKDALTKYQQATRVELASVTQISQPTVNMLISQLMKEKVVVSLGMAKSTGGRKAEVFALNNKRFCIASFIVRETYFEYIVTDLELNEETSGKEKRDAQVSYLEQLCRIIRRILAGNKYIKAITVGVPGAVSASGEVFAIPKIPEWENFNLQIFLAREFSLAAAVMNDINAVAVGYSGSYQEGTQNMVYLHAGNNGIGAGLIIDGRLYTGVKSFAGEVGFMQPGEGINRKRIEDSDNNPYRIALLEKIVTNIICILNPEKIVIGGDDIPADLLESLYDACIKHLPKEVMPGLVIIESGTEYYFKGLGEAGKKLLDENIRLA